MLMQTRKTQVMKEKENSSGAFLDSFSMNGGEGPYSYANNSEYQKGGSDLAKELINQEISTKMDVKLLCSSNLFNIADLGCSVGPNTYSVVQNIIEAVELRCESQGLISKNLDYQVFFNDQVPNDFNTLFKNLPPERIYFAVGVPGSFYGRLFPEASLHFVHSSYAVQWLSRVPKPVQDISSPAWNKGKIHYTSSGEVEMAYAAQFADDMDIFLNARAQELVSGGFMVLLMFCVPDGENLSKCTTTATLELLGSCLLDMAKMGLVDDSKVDSFNLPLYVPSRPELEDLINKNGCFKINRMVQMDRQMTHATKQAVEKFSFLARAAFEGLIQRHFGSEIINDLFDLFTKKLAESCIFTDSANYAPQTDIIVLLERTNA